MDAPADPEVRLTMNDEVYNQFYVVKAREARDEENRPYSEWVIRLGASTHTIEAYESKRDAVSRAEEVAENRDKAGVIVANTQGEVQKVKPNEDSSLYRHALRTATVSGE